MILHIFRRFANLPFGLERLDEAAAGRVTSADLRAALPSLLRSGHLVSLSKAWGEQQYYIPVDHLPFIWERLALPTLEARNNDRVTLVKEARPGLAIDLFRALTWIARHGLPITSKGTIHQRTVNKLKEQLYLKDGDVAGLELHYPDPEVYPPQIAVILDLLQALELLKRESSMWGLDTRVLASWLHLETKMMDAVIFRELLNQYVPSDAPIIHSVYRMFHRDIKGGSWYSLKQLYGSLCHLRMIPVSDYKLDRLFCWMENWLHALAGFGWVDMGRTAEDEMLFRWRRKPDLRLLDSLRDASTDSSPVHIFVQPDFEILVPLEVPCHVLWELELCSDNVTMDVMSVYRLNRSSIAYATEHGRSPADVLTFLETHSTGVPDNVQLALKQWGKELSTVPFKNKRSMAPQYPLIHKASDPLERVAFGEKSGSFAWSVAAVDLQKDDPKGNIPGQEELFPAWREIPAMWLKEMRSYHGSTARQMINQSLLWKTKVLLQIDGTSAEFIPVSLEGDERWSCRGYLFLNPSESGDGEGVWTELSPGQWEAMQLLVPEIH